MNKLLLIVIILFISINMFSQNNYKDYYRLRNKAMEYHVIMNYDMAIRFYNEAFNSAYPFPDDMKLLYNCYTQIKDFKKADLVLKKMILSGYKLKNNIPLIRIKDFNINKVIENDTNILNNNYLLKNYDYLRKKYLSNINEYNDQYLKSIEICEAFASKSRSLVEEDDTICDNFYIVQEATFSLKNELLLALLTSDIDISRSNTDSWLDHDFILAIIHTSQSLNDNRINEFMNLLWQQVLNGNIIAEQYAVIEDWLFYKKNNISKLGTQLTFEDDGIKIVELYDYKNIDKLREEKLLPPLWVYCKLKGIEIPKNYRYDFNIDR